MVAAKLLNKELKSTNPIRRRELITLIREELQRTESNAEYTTKQLRSNVMKSLGNAKVATLETCLEICEMLKERCSIRNSMRIYVALVRSLSRTSFVGWTALRENDAKYYPPIHDCNHDLKLSLSLV